MSGLAEILEENQRLREREAVLAAREAALTIVVQEQGEALRQKDHDLQTVTAQRDAVRLRAEQLAQELELIRLRRFGPVSQRHIDDDAQPVLAMFGDITAPPRLAVVEPAAPAEPAAPSRRLAVSAPQQPRRRSREDFRHLPSRKVVCPAPPDQTCAKCKGALRVVGKAETFRVGWEPGHFVVEDLVRDKCACPDCPGEGVLTVPAPYALDKALCADSLLARVLVDKFGDHLPLNRQRDRMAREGLDVGTSTLSAWVVAAASVLRPVAHAVRGELLAAPFLQGDDTGMPVQDGGDGALRKGRFWAFTDQEQVLYAFTDTKEGHFPEKLLKGFEGNCLLVDGGTEFNKVVGALDLDRAGCWSHLRTYFFNALPFHPAEANTALGTLRDLFLLERQLAHLSAHERLAERRTHATPLVDGLFRWIRELSAVARPKSKLMEALTYALNQETTLRVFLERGDVPIHNNLSELLLRQPVVGRKNWLFARSEGGAQAAATLFTLIGSCRLQGIDPHGYLVDVLGRVQDCTTPKSLTPRAWRQARSHPRTG
jgi:transposase